MVIGCCIDAQVAAPKGPWVAEQAPKEKEKDGGGGGTHSGTGFFVAPGHIVTNFHIVKQCNAAPQVSYPGFKSVVAYVDGVDEGSDLVILETKLTHRGIAAFRLRPKLGEAVASYGFPLRNILAPEGNFTLGNLSSTTGLDGDSKSFQFSAPVQNGNSGGPVMDMSGRVLGVASWILKPVNEAAPQNVNFAISAAIVTNFLELKEISPVYQQGTGARMEPESLAEYAKKFTVQVTCEAQ